MIIPPRPQIHPLTLKSKISPLTPIISLLRLQISTFWRQISLIRPQIHSQRHQWKSPCVLQDFVFFGADALLSFFQIYNHLKQGNGYRWPHIKLKLLLVLGECKVLSRVGPSLTLGQTPVPCKDVATTLLFICRHTILYSIYSAPCYVISLVGLSVGPLSTFPAFMSSFSSLLLHNCAYKFFYHRALLLTHMRLGQPCIWPCFLPILHRVVQSTV